MYVLKRFLRYYVPYKSVFFLDLLCASIISIIDLVYPQLLRHLINTVFIQGEAVILRSLPPIGAGLFAGYLLQTVCRYYVTYQGHVMGARMERDMRKDLFEHYEALSFSFYDRSNTGQLMSRLVTDLFDISELAHHGPENLFISLVKLAGSFLILSRIQWKLAMILLGIVVLMALFSATQNRRMRETFLDNRRKLGDINSTLQDSLAGIRIVQSFANEKVEEEKFRRGNEAFLVSKKENYKAMGIFQTGNLFFTGMLYLATLLFGGYFVAKGQMLPSDLTMFALYIGIFISPIQVLVELMETMQKGLSGFRRFLEIVDAVPEIQDEPDAVPICHPDGDIVYDHVSFEYGNNDIVLKDVNLKIHSGQSIALVGPSGGGKTTICSLLPRFYDVSEGQITIGGQDIRHITLESLRNSIGMVQQDVYMFGGNIAENIAYGKPDATMDEIIEAAKKANIHDFIQSLPDGYQTLVGERGARLSGGQKQRISIARVFLKNPPILILDEATSALDNESERYIQKSLDELSKDRTTITIAHRLSTIRGADEILVIDGNGVAERGSHDKLMANGGIYAKYYEMQ